MNAPREAALSEKPIPVGVVTYVLKKASELNLRGELVSHAPRGATIVQFVHSKPGSPAHQKADEAFHDKLKRANREGTRPGNVGRHILDYTFSIHAARPARVTFLALSPKAAAHLLANVHIPGELR